MLHFYSSYLGRIQFVMSILKIYKNLISIFTKWKYQCPTQKIHFNIRKSVESSVAVDETCWINRCGVCVGWRCISLVNVRLIGNLLHKLLGKMQRWSFHQYFEIHFAPSVFWIQLQSWRMKKCEFKDKFIQKTFTARMLREIGIWEMFSISKGAQHGLIFKRFASLTFTLTSIPVCRWQAKMLIGELVCFDF